MNGSLSGLIRFPVCTGKIPAPQKPEFPQGSCKPEFPQAPEQPDAPENNGAPGAGNGVQDPGAAKAAGVRAREIRISFSHTRPDGRDFSTALSEAGASFRASGENIAYGQNSAGQVMEVWMNSPGHRANLLNPGYSRIGIGHVKDSRGVDHWVQLFLN